MKTIDKIKELASDLEESIKVIDSVRIKHSIIKLLDQIPKEIELIEVTKDQENHKAAASAGLIVDFDIMHYNNTRIENLKQEIDEAIK